jgi:hypothetical protein
MLLDSLKTGQVPSVHDILLQMDAHNPAHDLTYVDMRSELEYFGVKDAIDVYTMPLGLLASLGDMGKNHATQLHQYVRDHALHPLGLLHTGGGRATGSVGGISGDVDVAPIEGEKKELTLTCKDEKSQEDIIHWLEAVTEGESDSEGVDELQSDTGEDEDEGGSEDDVASQEV